jgi:hypothetical protein
MGVKVRKGKVKKRKVHPAILTANVSFRTEITDDVVVNSIMNMEMPREWEFHFYDFFTDNPVEWILDFCEEKNIPLERLKEFYEKFIKPYYRNRRLEGVWEVE